MGFEKSIGSEMTENKTNIEAPEGYFLAGHEARGERSDEEIILEYQAKTRPAAKIEIITDPEDDKMVYVHVEKFFNQAE